MNHNQDKEQDKPDYLSEQLPLIWYCRDCGVSNASHEKRCFHCGVRDYAALKADAQTVEKLREVYGILQNVNIGNVCKVDKVNKLIDELLNSSEDLRGKGSV
jgi:hypothetical protein